MKKSIQKLVLKSIQKSIGFYFNMASFIHPKWVAKKGFILFCSPMSPKLKKHQSDFLAIGKDSLLDFETKKIQTYKWGTGSKKILLIHGWASHSFRWKAYIEQLVAQDFTVYAFDAPAHGLSEGKILHVVLYSKVMDLFLKQNTDIQHIMSHSIGGFATIYWLFQNKEHPIKNVVIMAAPGEADDFFNFYQATLGLSNRALRIIKNRFVELLDQDPSYFSTASFAKSLSTKSLIIHDKGDKDTAPQYSVALHDNWKESKLILTEGLGHALKSKKLQTEVIQFLLEP
jgi:pimeloyl-ACP methyl ester carboxylesterase